MDTIETTLSNGIQDSDEGCIESKPVISEHGIVGETSSSRVNSSAITLRLPIETNIHNSGTLSYRIIPVKVDPSMESLPEGENTTVPITTPILATHISSETVEQKLALISASEPSTETNQTVVVSGGQVYLIPDTTNVTSRSRNFLPRTTDSILNQRMSTSREEKRRVTHNEVERRRRDKINNWICRLAKVLPECSEMQSKTSQVSKGVILAKACDYIEDLRKQVRHLTDRLTIAEMKQNPSDFREEIEILKQENSALKNENAMLKARLHQHGILEESLGS